MTIYQRKLEETIRKKCQTSTLSETIELLFNLGVIDNTLIKVLVIREYVNEKVKTGISKLDAMWQATEAFACSYEYVRKCLYYYKDINVDNAVSKSV